MPLRSGTKFAASHSRPVRSPRGDHSRDERGEALPAAILFLSMFLTVLLGVHIVIVAMARTAVQSAADAALAAAQAAGPGSTTCDGATRTARECGAIVAARLAMAGAASSILETRPPVIALATERGTVSVLVFGGTISPVLGGVEVTGEACGPLDDVPPSELTAGSADIWRC